MSFECDPCHKIATGKSLDEMVHMFRSWGPCESCHVTSVTGDCRCSGDWPRARAVGARRYAMLEIIEEVETLSADYSEAVKEIMRMGRENPLPEEEQLRLMTKIGHILAKHGQLPDEPPEQWAARVVRERREAEAKT